MTALQEANLLWATWGDVDPEASLNLPPAVTSARDPTRVFVREEKTLLALYLPVSIKEPCLCCVV